MPPEGLCGLFPLAQQTCALQGVEIGQQFPQLQGGRRMCQGFVAVTRNEYPLELANDFAEIPAISSGLI